MVNSVECFSYVQRGHPKLFPYSSDFSTAVRMMCAAFVHPRPGPNPNCSLSKPLSMLGKIRLHKTVRKSCDGP
eukprot:9503577-Pyramimonas_sp.AAC.1